MTIYERIGVICVDVEEKPYSSDSAIRTIRNIAVQENYNGDQDILSIRSYAQSYLASQMTPERAITLIRSICERRVAESVNSKIDK